MAIGMKGSVSTDLEERLAALRTVVAEAIASKAPRRTVACLGAAVATALFGAASPRPPAAQACAQAANEMAPTRAARRRRRGLRRRKEVEAEEMEETEDKVAVEVVEAVEGDAQKDAASPAAPLEKPDNPVPVYKFGPTVEEKNVEMQDKTEWHSFGAGAQSSTPVDLETLLRELTLVKIGISFGVMLMHTLVFSRRGLRRYHGLRVQGGAVRPPRPSAGERMWFFFF